MIIDNVDKLRHIQLLSFGNNFIIKRIKSNLNYQVRRAIKVSTIQAT